MPRHGGPRHGMRNCRIRSKQNALQMAEALAGGNIGGFTAALAIAQKGAEVYPDGLGPFGPLCDLDTMGIWDEDIYILNAKIAGADGQEIDVFKTLCLLAAVMHNIISEQDLRVAIAEYKRTRVVSLDVTKIIAQVLAQSEKLRVYHEARRVACTG